MPGYPRSVKLWDPRAPRLLSALRSKQTARRQGDLPAQELRLKASKQVAVASRAKAWCHRPRRVGVTGRRRAGSVVAFFGLIGSQRNSEVGDFDIPAKDRDTKYVCLEIWMFKKDDCFPANPSWLVWF